MATSISFNGQVVTDGWGEHFKLWRGERITVWVNTNAVYLQVSPTQPPDPPLWDDPIYLPRGEFSRATPFGYFRFKLAVPGQQATVHFSANAARVAS